MTPSPSPSPAQRLADQEVAIFLFHGVVVTNDYEVRNYTRKHLPRDEFVATIDSQSRAGHALSMPEIVEHIIAGAPFPPRAFPVTFDHGFENNHSSPLGEIQSAWIHLEKSSPLGEIMGPDFYIRHAPFG